MSKIKGTHFLNVDLRVQSKSGLKELIDAFAPDVYELGSEDPQCAVFEVNTTYKEHFDDNGIFKPPTIDETILAFYNAIQALPPTVRAIWDEAESRRFDIGIKTDDEHYQTNFFVSRENIERLSSLKAGMRMALYASGDPKKYGFKG